MEVQIKRTDLYSIKNGITKFNALKIKDIFFVALIVRVKNTIEPLTKEMDEVLEQIIKSDEKEEFTRRVEEIREKYKKKDANGNVIMKVEEVEVDGKKNELQHFEMTDKSAFATDMYALNQEFKDAIEEEKKKVDEFNEKYLQEKVKVNLDRMSIQQMKLLPGEVLAAFAPFLPAVITMKDLKDVVLDTTQFEKISEYCEIK